MKILNVIASSNPKGGGPIAGIEAFSSVLLEEGHVFDVLCLDEPDSSWVKNSKINIFAIGPSVATYSYTSKLKPWLREHAKNYDCVIVRGLWQYCGLATWLVLKELSVPYFVFSHGMLDPWFNENYPLKKIKKYAYWLFVEHHVLKHSRGVLFNSQEELLRARDSFSPYELEEILVPYGISGLSADREKSVESFFEAVPEIAEKRFLLFLGRLHEKKGVDLLIESFAKVSHEDPELNLLIAGPGDLIVYKEILLRLPGEIVNKIYFAGMLSGAKKEGAFFAAEAFCLFSHQENFGIAVAEALSTGLPVLISNKVNIWKEILDSGAGLADGDDILGATSLLQRWCKLPASAKDQMRVRAKECFDERYQIKDNAIKFVEVLEGLIER